jgi:hypothetical protein
LSRFTHLSPGRTVCLPVENLLQCNIATIWAEFAIHLTCCQKTPHCYLRRESRRNLSQINRTKGG